MFTDDMKQDQELADILKNFIYNEVVNQNDLDEKLRYEAVLGTLLGCQSVDLFKLMTKEALDHDVSPIAIKEVVYQAVAYLGIGRVYPFIQATNEVFNQKAIALPLASQATTSLENRREKGTEKQVEIFGEGMQDFWKTGDETTVHINYWLASNCFGDYYTRKGLSLREREMVTFTYILAQGGCESQLKSHIQGNMHVGNDSLFLIKVLSQVMPFIGYPRTLNALRCINEMK